MPANEHESRLEELRLANTARCAVFLRDHGPAAVSEVAKSTGLSRPTVEGALADLGARGLVKTDEGREPHRVGRPARVASFRGEAGYLVGVDIGLSEVRVIVSDLAGRVVASRTGALGSEGTAGGLTGRVAGVITDALDESGAPRERLVVVHVGITGIVTADGRLLASDAFPTWAGVDISEQLSSSLGCPVQLDNDVNLAAVGEQRLGAARGVDDALFFLVGTQISAGLVLDGKLRRGRHDAAGELDARNIRVPLDENGHVAWRSAPTGDQVFALAALGDAGAKDEIRTFVSGLADTMHVMIQTVDPELVVIGGQLSQERELLIEPLAKGLARRSSRPLLTDVVASHLGETAIAGGALARAFDRSSIIIYGVSGVAMPEVQAPDGDWPAQEHRDSALPVPCAGSVGPADAADTAPTGG